MSETLKRDAEYLSPALGRAFDLVAVKGEGSFLYGEDGKKYLDLTSGIAVNQLGHCHPEVVEAIAKQAASCIHTSCVVHYPANIDLAEKIASITPGDLNNTFFCNSGAEAVDGSIKFAKKLKPGRTNFIAFKGAFHGRSLGATAFTSSKSAYRKFYDPLIPGIHHLSFPNIYEAKTQEARDKLVEHHEKIFLSYFDTVVHPESVAAIIIEPMQGEGGYIPAPGLDGSKNYLQFLRDFCDKHEILLIFDEVQSGIARTGKWFASNHYGVVPDVQLMAKGLSGGLPLGAFSSRKELMYEMPPGSHGTTFGGNPISCRAALKLLEIIERDNVMDNVNARSEQVFKFFESKFPGSDSRKPREDLNDKIKVRGLGLMIALVFPDAETVTKVKNYAYDKGVLLLGCGTYGNIIRLAPDLTITAENLQQGLDIIAEAIAK
ncbi:MAG: aminotransferase class III-fold pyridoxal phosphate-dependent enzyme [Candidatus Melainabacteria bacterium]|nr:aminotransferase class III-fold pyridoxal phosphate-dependent enzyme [Candidatus Melainabacteria bacterium]